MLKLVVALCNFAIGVLLAVVTAQIGSLFFSGQGQFGIFLSLIVTGCIALVFLLDWFGNRIRNVLFGWIGLPTTIPTLDAKAKIRPIYWGVLGFFLGLAASAVLTPDAVFSVFRPLIN